MKSFLVFCFLSIMSCSGVFLPLVMAASEGRSGHTSTDKMLEFSLLRLKESVQKTLQKNERLSFENDMLHKSIQDLRQVKEVLAEKKAELYGRDTAYNRQQEYLPLTKILDIHDRGKRTQELIAIFQRDIGRLREKNKILEDSISEKGFVSYRQMLLEKREKSGQDLLKAEKKLKFLEQQNQGPLEKIEKLKNEQSILVRQIEALQSNYRRF